MIVLLVTGTRRELSCDDWAKINTPLRGTHDCARRARAAGYNVTFHPVGL